MYNMYCFVHNIKNSRRNDHFFPAKVSPKSQKSSKKAYFVKICCPKGAGALWHTLQSIFRRVQRCKIDPILGNTLYE